MKRLFAAVLVFAITICCAYAEQPFAGIGGGLNSGMPEASDVSATDSAAGFSIGSFLSGSNQHTDTEPLHGSDFLNARLEVVPWPELPTEGIPVFYDENACVVLGLPGDGNAPYIYYPRTGQLRPLSVYSEDMPIWEEMVVEPMLQLGFTREDIDEYVGYGNYAEYYFYMIRGQDTLTSMAVKPGKVILNYLLASFVIDTQRGVISPAEDDVTLYDGSVDWLDEDDVDYIYTDADGKKTEVVLIGDPGYEYIPRCIDFDWDAAAISVYESGTHNRPVRFAMGFADGYDTGSMEFVDMGTYVASGGPNMARLCGSNSAIAYNKATLLMYPLLLVRRDTAEALALMWDGETMTGVNVNDLIDESGTVSVKGYDYRYLSFLDVSDDGRYAAFIESGSGDLLVMDIETLETRCLMTQAEMDSMGYGKMMDDLIGWYVGDTIIGKNGYYLQFVFE